jgi:hypothetical protein
MWPLCQPGNVKALFPHIALQLTLPIYIMRWCSDHVNLNIMIGCSFLMNCNSNRLHSSSRLFSVFRTFPTSFPTQHVQHLASPRVLSPPSRSIKGAYKTNQSTRVRWCSTDSRCQLDVGWKAVAPSPDSGDGSATRVDVSGIWIRAVVRCRTQDVRCHIIPT